MTTPDAVQRTTRIRLVREAELPLLREIERASGEIFRDIDMALVADDEPSSVLELAHYQEAGRCWVVTGDDPAQAHPEPAGALLGYLLAEPVDGNLHVAQVSVHPAAAGRRLGAALIEHLARLAVEQGAAGLTLTTYRDVPWNAPYYRRLGFTEIPEARLSPGLRAIRELERTAGLDRWPRLAMFRPH
ncbi:MAG TPA: GNAT family N-acetyltransferase [Pseudonocardia sp.]|nr:GNAT family N-acetyltransferase [Pseudonocardia sp.]